MGTAVKYSLVFILCLQYFAARSQYESETFDHLSVDDGLSSSVVTSILKDSRGFMWFGTQNGLNRFDAYGFITWTSSDTLPGSISGNFILSLFEDSDSTLWIGTEQNGLNRYDRDKNTFIVYRNNQTDTTSLAGNSVNDIFETSGHDLLVASGKGLQIFNRKTGTFSSYLVSGIGKFAHMAVMDLYEDTDQTLWIGTDHGLFHHDAAHHTFDHFLYDPADSNTISNNSVNQVMRDQGGRLLIATNEGINVFHEDSKTFSRYYYDPADADSRAKSEIQALTEDNRGNVWIGSFGGGLIKTKTGSTETAIFTSTPENPHSLSSDYINALYFDDAGILWIGTYGGGVNKIDQVRIRFENISHIPDNPNSPSGDEVYAIFTDTSHLYFGTEKGVSICSRKTGLYTHHLHDPANPNSLSGNTVYCIEKDSTADLWIGTAGSGLNLLTKEDIEKGTFNFDHFSKEGTVGHALPGNSVLSLLAAGDSTLWVGTNHGIALLKNRNIVATFRHEADKPASLSDEEIYCIYEDRDHHIWVGTYHGLNLFDRADSSFMRFDSIPDLSNPTIYTILNDENGNLWLGTDNTGLIRFDPRNPTDHKVFTKSDGLPDNVIYGILEDGDGNLWMSSNNGLFKVIRQTDPDKITVVPFNSTKWLTTDAFNIGAYHKDNKGVLYFGSFDGVTMFHPENVRGNDYVPPVYIIGFELFFKPVRISDDGSTPLSASISETRRIVLNHNQNVLKFEFTALNYIEPQENRYAFMMEGLENNWNYSRSQREAQYLYLPPGEYRFRVRASNNDGLWNNKGAAIDIIIKPPFTQTIWFYILLTGGLLLLGWWIMHIRTRRLKIIRNRLEEQVQIRTYELRETNKSLEAEIQERLKVEEALKKSEARFRQLIETMNEGFSVQDKQGKITYVNPRLCEMFGYSSDEIIGRYPTDFVDTSDPDNLEKFYSNREKGIKSGVIPSYELRWRHKSGKLFETMVSPKPIIDPKEGYTGSVAVLTDITDLKNAEQELISKNKAINEALDDLRKTQAQLIDSEKMASLGQLTAGVAHEINNPINFVSGNVQPLRRDIQDVLEVLHQYDRIIETLKLENSFDKIRELKQEIDFDFVLQEINHLLDGIGEGAQRTAEIVKGLRNFSRMDEHELKAADVNQGIESTLLILHNKLKQNIEVVKEYGKIPEIMCYPGQLNQVFMNVINNAVEAIEGEGKITIRTWKENGRVKISIKDTGKGIPDKMKKRIFEPFYTTKEVGKGTGLGLSISFGIIEKHNGNIEVKSQPGNGTEFIISVPIDLK